MMGFLSPMRIFFVLFCSIANAARAHDVVVKDKQFLLGERPIPPGCIVMLNPELNGDQVIASVFIDRPAYRGCLDANITFPQQDPGARPPTYEVVHSAGDQVYWVKSCAYLAQGSLGKSCSRMTIRFEHRDYDSKQGAKKLLAVSAIGEWSEHIWPTPNKAFDAEQEVLSIRKHYRAVAGNRRLKTAVHKRNCSSAKNDKVEVTQRFVGTGVGEVVESHVQGPTHGSASYIYKKDKLVFAYLEHVDPTQNTQDRIYFKDEKAFLCKKTHLGRAPEGFEVNVAKVVPCVADQVEEVLSQRHKRLPVKDGQPFTKYPRWCD